MIDPSGEQFFSPGDEGGGGGNGPDKNVARDWMEERLKRIGESFKKQLPITDENRPEAKRDVRTALQLMQGKMATAANYDKKVVDFVSDLFADKEFISKFVDQNLDMIIVPLSVFLAGEIGAEAFLIEMGLRVAHTTGVDKAVSRHIAKNIQEKIKLIDKAAQAVGNATIVGQAGKAIESLQAYIEDKPVPDEPPALGTDDTEKVLDHIEDVLEEDAVPFAPAGGGAGGGEPPEKPPAPPGGGEPPEPPKPPEGEDDEVLRKIEAERSKLLKYDTRIFSYFNEAMNRAREDDDQDEVVRLRDQYRRLSSFLKAGRQVRGAGEIDPAEVNRLLQEIGLNNEEIAEYDAVSELFRQDFSIHERIAYYGYRQIAERLMELNDAAVISGLFIERDGKFELDDGKIEKFAEAITDIVDVLFRRVDQSPNVRFGSIYNELIQGNVLHYIVDYLSNLKDSENLREILRGNGVNLDEFDTFFENRIIKEIYISRTYRELYHDIPNILGQADFENLAKVVAQYGVSEISIFTHNATTNKVISEFEAYVQELLVRNGNKIRPNLFAGQYQEKGRYHAATDELNFVRLLKDLFPDKNREQLLRAFSIGRGVSLINTFRTPELLAMAKADKGFVDYYLSRLLTVMNPLHYWTIERGGRGITLAKWAMVTPVELRKRGTDVLGKINQMVRNPFIPKNIFDNVEAWEKDMYEMVEDKQKTERQITDEAKAIKDFWLYSQDTFYRLMQLISLKALIGRFGWRSKGIEKDFKMDKTLNPDAVDLEKDWINGYDWLAKKAGVVARWFFDNRRATDEAKRLVLSVEMGEGHQLEEQSLKFDAIWKRYQSGKSKINARVGNVDIDGRHDVEEQMTANEYIEQREIVLKGWNFYRLLLKDPMSFINNFSQFMPDISPDKSIEVKAFVDSDGNRIELDTPLELDPATFYFTQDWLPEGMSLPEKQHLERENILAFLRNRFGRVVKNEFGQVLPTAKLDPAMQQHIEFIMDFHTRVRDSKQRDNLYKELRKAYQKARDREDNHITADDIENIQIRNLMFGSGGYEGFITYFKNLVDSEVEYFGDRTETNEDEEVVENIGSRGFFYRFANAWFNKDFIDTIPQGDFNVNIFFRHGTETGESMMFRATSDLATTHKVQEKVVVGLHQTVRDAARNNDDKPIYEMHQQIQALRGIKGESTEKIHQLFGTLITRYFQEHAVSRLPFIGPIASWIPGMELSISKLDLKTIEATSWKSDRIYRYHKNLQNLTFITEEQRKALDENVGVELAKTIPFELAPTTILFLYLFVFYEYIKKAFADATGQRQAA